MSAPGRPGGLGLPRLRLTRIERYVLVCLNCIGGDFAFAISSLRKARPIGPHSPQQDCRW